MTMWKPDRRGLVAWAKMSVILAVIGLSSTTFATVGFVPPPPGLHRVGAASIGTLTLSIQGQPIGLGLMSFVGQCQGMDVTWGPLDVDVDHAFFMAADGKQLASDLKGRTDPRLDGLAVCFPSASPSLVELTTVTQGSKAASTSDDFTGNAVILGLVSN